MGTRSITHVHCHLTDTIICSFYRHWDGYPSAHGRDLRTWLCNKHLVNGITSDHIEGVHFNRAGTLAVKLMNHIQDIAGCEVIPTGAFGYGEEYTYHVRYHKDIQKFGIMVDSQYYATSSLEDVL